MLLESHSTHFKRGVQEVVAAAAGGSVLMRATHFLVEESTHADTTTIQLFGTLDFKLGATV